jgi:hypothetical protein
MFERRYNVAYNSETVAEFSVENFGWDLPDCSVANSADCKTYNYFYGVHVKEIDTSAIFNVAPCMLPHLFYIPTHALFTL